VIQFLEFLYQNVPEIYTYSQTAEFLSSLVSTLFPVEEHKELMEFNVEVRNFRPVLMDVKTIENNLLY